jgi:DHA2 family multidrug resistance protein
VFFINVPVGIASLLLSQRMVSDPPHLKVARERSGGIDYIGLTLIAVGLGCAEVVLDKGQEEDWFHSSFITGFALVAVVTLVVFVLWEWQQENPVVDVRMFKSRNFATANVMMLTLGVALYGSTVLLPEFMQLLMGYSAQRSGMALSPGGLVVISLLPLVGILVSRVDPRYLIAFGFTVLSASLLYMTHHLYVGIDFRTAVALRAYQSVGLAFLFVPINTVVYNGVAPEKNNAVAGIVNLSRNMGGDVGIAFVTTLIARRAQAHQATLASYTSAYNPVFTARLAAIARGMERAGASSVDAAHRALAAFYRQLMLQASTLAFLDALRMLGIATALMIPLVLLTERVRVGAAPGGH